MKKFFNEFKAFIAKGNVVDLAVAVVVGGAFKEIVNSLVSSIIMPLIGRITGGVNISALSFELAPTVTDESGAVITPAVTLGYGAFVQSIIDFLLISFSIFLVLRVFLAAKTRADAIMHKNDAEKEEEKNPETELDILKEIRDHLVGKPEEESKEASGKSDE